MKATWLGLNKVQWTVIFVSAVLGFLLGWFLPHKQVPMHGEPVDVVIVPMGDSFVPVVY